MCTCTHGTIHGGSRVGTGVRSRVRTPTPRRRVSAHAGTPRQPRLRTAKFQFAARPRDRSYPLGSQHVRARRATAAPVCVCSSRLHRPPCDRHLRARQVCRLYKPLFTSCSRGVETARTPLGLGKCAPKITFCAGMRQSVPQGIRARATGNHPPAYILGFKNG